MDVILYNTLSREKEVFKPTHDPVAMYTCGPTVYQRAHIGNLRSFFVADVLKKVLEYNSYSVKQIVNITDVGHLVSDQDEGEDKMEKEAKKEHKTAQEIAEQYTGLFFKDIDAMHIARATEFPRATQHIQEQIELIRKLEEKGFVYKTQDGLYFDTSLFTAYPDLARLDLKGLQEGARVEKNIDKKNPSDFALWKFSPEGEKRQQEWDSPWGIGFPGWHLECSAMSMKYLGEQIDIHTGGVDHIPVHHTNEIAQSECATGKKFVQYWIHSEFLSVDGEKMSKSLGNVFNLDDLREKGFSPLSFRYLLLSAHYRSKMNFTWDALLSAQTALKRLHASFSEMPEGGVVDPSCEESFHAAVNDDLNTPEALSVVWNFMKDSQISDADKRATLIHFDKILSLGFSATPEAYQGFLAELFSGDEILVSELPQDMQKKIQDRDKAREEKDWAKADSLRAELQSNGYDPIDTPEGVKKVKKIG